MDGPVELAYGPSALQRVDVYGSGPHLALFIHGGLYVDGDKHEHVALARELTSLPGWSVAVINYRLSGAKAGADAVMAPQHTHDAAAAVVATLAHVRPLYWVLIGHSVGAHMAALLLVNPGWRFFDALSVPPPPVAMIGVQGMYDNKLFCVDFPEWAAELYVSQTADQSTWLEPTALEPCSVDALRRTAFHLVHAEADKYVNVAQAHAWQRALRAWGIDSSLQSGPGGHFDGVRGEHVPWLGERLRALLSASLPSVDGADERRRMLAAGYRVGHEAGEQHALQQSFNDGFATEAPYWLALSSLYGALTHAAKLDAALAERVAPVCAALGRAIESGEQCDLGAAKELCAALKL